MADKILCPWCGAEMYATGGYHEAMWTGQMTCMGCGANGPRVRSLCGGETVLGKARAAALRRYTPPILCETCGEFGWDLPQCRNTDGTKYGRKECKYWSRKPTDEERSAAEWEN